MTELTAFDKALAAFQLALAAAAESGEVTDLRISQHREVTPEYSHDHHNFGRPVAFHPGDTEVSISFTIPAKP